jgi:hypothetical protein
MGDNAAVQQAIQQALSEALGTIQRQLGEVESSFDQVRGLLQEAGGSESAERFVTLLPPLMHMQAAGAALTASIETVLRFVGSSAHWTGLGAVAVAAPPPAAAEAPVAESEAAPAEEAPVAEPEAAEAPPAEEAVEAPAGEEGTVSEIALEPVAEVEAEVAEEAVAPAEPVDVESLPEELQKMHKKAARFARVTVQELFMYKKEEVEKGRENKDLYERFKEEIDKSKTLYDQKFQQIADHNVDYLYDELVRVLAENDPAALGNYPYSTPGR